MNNEAMHPGVDQEQNYRSALNAMRDIFFDQSLDQISRKAIMKGLVQEWLDKYATDLKDEKKRYVKDVIEDTIQLLQSA